MNDMITMPRKVVEQVLHALRYKGTGAYKVKVPAINALREALDAEQTEQQTDRVPFCLVEDVIDNDSILTQMGVNRGDKLYTR